MRHLYKERITLNLMSTLDTYPINLYEPLQNISSDCFHNN